MARVLVIGDLHAPAVHPGYLDFCKDLREDYETDRTVLIGDVTDQHTASKHMMDPDGRGPREEFRDTKREVAVWHSAFPDASVCIGNHDERFIKRIMEAGLPRAALRSYNNLWGTPTWTWRESFEIDGVHYSHGTGCGGINPAYNYMKLLGKSTVIGHTHSNAGIKWVANQYKRMFAMDVGCGIDCQHPAFRYGSAYRTKPVLAAAVVLDGVPVHHIMEADPGERYSREHYE